MQGIDSNTGKAISGIDHLRQSIRDILTTPLGSRVMRETYGSRLFDLIDHPINSVTMIEIYSATAEALMRWEPRFVVKRVQVESVSLGQIVLLLEGDYIPRREPLILSDLKLNF
ncbi:GPW/gp25 family protein [Teredinibacter sp. KSP-S5-2]|uniref:GPW/gp25 family protein n=1 Tax=Teredinibacter sp. KSP-S5-2 TaxID=3034506 RepID=UPI0029351ED2|nr:GPW/gp25 family protein [Teredinibacter sp. KSP-S5-2]WNO10437.1 GPW/gp25 family protein [Teredinibacter sp. KSP-S5-2]